MDTTILGFLDWAATHQVDFVLCRDAEDDMGEVRTMPFDLADGERERMVRDYLALAAPDGAGTVAKAQRIIDAGYEVRRWANRDRLKFGGALLGLLQAIEAAMSPDQWRSYGEELSGRNDPDFRAKLAEHGLLEAFERTWAGHDAALAAAGVPGGNEGSEG